MKELLVDVESGGDTRLALLEDGVLEEYGVELAGDRSRRGNIYRGRVTNVEAGIQSAFVDLGVERNGFLHVSDCRPGLTGRGHDGESGDQAIQDVLARGDEITVQVTREGIGKKGPTVSTFLSLPGRHLVLLPGGQRVGVSKRITDPETRHELRRRLASLERPDGAGFIIRTAGEGTTTEALARDLARVTGLWERIRAREASARVPALLHEASGLIARTLRDLVDDEVAVVRVGSDAAAAAVEAFCESEMPELRSRIVRERGSSPLFAAPRVERQVARALAPRVPLPNGGSIVIEQTEALVAIDVNSGRYTEKRDLEQTARSTNLEAIEEIARQIRLRDLGGLIVVDLIDMRLAEHRREVEEAFRAALARDRARLRWTGLSEFGVIEMTRQRVGPGMLAATQRPCPHCDGRGRVLRGRGVRSEE